MSITPITEIYRQTLADFPVQPVVVSDTLIALQRALTEPFDLLITTNEIPVLNGAALIGALKLSAGRNQNIKTILITSNHDAATRKKRATDADYVIIKNAQLMENLTAIAKRIIASANRQT